MRICVYGAGSVGGYLAARLAKAGREVSVVARGPHLAAIRVGGLTLQTPEERFTVPVAASDDPADLGRQDLVIVGAKHPALPGIAERIGPLLGPDTPVVFAMNGVLWFTADLPRLDPTGSIRRHIGIERALGLIIESPNEVVEPGVVENTGKRNRFTLGLRAVDRRRPDRAACCGRGRLRTLRLHRRQPCSTTESAGGARSHRSRQGAPSPTRGGVVGGAARHRWRRLHVVAPAQREAGADPVGDGRGRPR